MNTLRDRINKDTIFDSDWSVQASPNAREVSVRQYVDRLAYARTFRRQNHHSSISRRTGGRRRVTETVRLGDEDESFTRCGCRCSMILSDRAVPRIRLGSNLPSTGSSGSGSCILPSDNMNRQVTVALALLVVLASDSGFIDGATTNDTSDRVSVTIGAQNSS